jgi:hypothetical protein
VWTEYSRNNWYPCIITEDQNTNQGKIFIKTHLKIFKAFNLISANKKNGVWLKYLNYEGMHGNVTMNNIFAFKGLEEFWTEIVNRKISKSKIKKFSPFVLRAIEEAKIFMEFEEILRLDILDAILKLQSGTKYKKVIRKDIFDDSNGVPSNLRPFIEKYIKHMLAYDVAVGIRKAGQKQNALSKALKNDSEAAKALMDLPSVVDLLDSNQTKVEKTDVRQSVRISTKRRLSIVSVSSKENEPNKAPQHQPKKSRLSTLEAYESVNQNRPIAPVKLIEGVEQDPCKCKPDDPSPCGKGSECIFRHLEMECGKKCPAEESCQNNKLRLRKYAEIELKKTSNRGFGVIASEYIPAGTLIIEYVGEIINKAEMLRRLSKKRARNDKDFYFMGVDADLYIDAEPCGNKSRFINHSCNPNCDTFKIEVEGNSRMAIVSRFNIPKVS